MASKPKRERVKPYWYADLSPKAKAVYDATDWEAEEADCWLDDEESMAMPVRTPRPGRT